MKTWGVIGLIVFPLVLGGATTRPVSGPATQAVRLEDTPAPTARALLKGLEVFLRQEHADPRAAEHTLGDLSRSVSDRPVEAVLSLAGLRISQVSADKLRRTRQEILGSWAAVINFYTDHIDYGRMTVGMLPTMGTAEPPAAYVLFYAVRPDFPQPIQIRIACIRESGAWKVRGVSLLPAP